MRTAHITSFLLLAAFLFVPALSYAHVLKSDGDIGIVMHLDPEDEPVAGVVTPMYFAFHDTTGRFSFDACDCKGLAVAYAERADIEKSGSDIFLHVHGDQLNADGSFLFPKPDVYTIEIEGTPKDGVSFKPFKILFDVRVASYADTSIAPSATSFWTTHWPHFIIFGGGFLFFIGAVVYDRRKRA